MGGNWILIFLETSLMFINNMFEKLYGILSVNPVTYAEGKIWNTVNTIYEAFLGSAISLMIIFIYLGIIEDAGEMIKHRNPGPAIWAFIKIMFGAGILICGRYILVLIFWIFKEFMDKIMLKNGSNVFVAATWVEVPDSIRESVQNLNLTDGIVLWAASFIAALIIMVTCFTVLLVVYGRIFKIYIHIAISPIPMACAASKTTMRYFLAFIISFIDVLLEGLVIVIASLLFAVFANSFDITSDFTAAETDNEWVTEYNRALEEIAGDPTLTDEEKERLYEIYAEKYLSNVESEIENIAGSRDRSAKNLWLFLGKTLFLYVMYAGIVKTSDDYVRRWTGV